MASALLLCFAIPAILALCGIFSRKGQGRYIPLFFLFSFVSVIVASVVQALTQPVFSELAAFSGETATLALHSFVQAALIEEACKAAFFFLALKKALSKQQDFRCTLEFLAFYFALFSGSLFASLETLSAILYRPSAAATRIFTAHILHPAALLVSASGLFLWKGSSGKGTLGAFIGIGLAIAIHGFYNFVAGMFSLNAAVFCAILALIAAAALWVKVFSRGCISSGKPLGESFAAKRVLKRNAESSTKPEKRENQ